MNKESNNFLQLSVKGLFFDNDNKAMMILEKDGTWELPGGRVERNEDLIECLKRECLEEMGLECEILDERPCIAYSTLDKSYRSRVILCYRVRFATLDFRTTDECVDIKFFTKDEIANLNTISHQLRKLTDYL